MTSKANASKTDVKTDDTIPTVTIFHNDARHATVHQFIPSDKATASVLVPSTIRPGSQVAIWPGKSKDKPDQQPIFQPVELVQQDWSIGELGRRWIGQEVIVNGDKQGTCLAVDADNRTITLRSSKGTTDIVVISKFTSVLCKTMVKATEPTNSYIQIPSSIGIPKAVLDPFMELAYTCGGLSWSVAYNLIRLSDSKLSMSRTLTVQNTSDFAFFANTKTAVNLVIGKLRSEHASPTMRRSKRVARAMDSEEAAEAPMMSLERKENTPKQEFHGELLMQRFVLPTGGLPTGTVYMPPQNQDEVIPDAKCFYEYTVECSHTPTPVTFGTEWVSTTQTLAPGTMRMYEAGGDTCLRTPLGQGSLDRIVQKGESVVMLFGQSSRVLVRATTTWHEPREHNSGNRCKTQRLVASLFLQLTERKLKDPLRLLIPIPFGQTALTKVDDVKAVFGDKWASSGLKIVHVPDSPQYVNVIRYDVSQAGELSESNEVLIELNFDFVEN